MNSSVLHRSDGQRESALRSGNAAIPVHHSSLPGSHAIFDFVDFDTRYYKFVQLYDSGSSRSGKHSSYHLLGPYQGLTYKSDQPDFVISAGFTPADDADYDKWYREEHLKEISGIRGWRKTSRWALDFARQNRSTGADNHLPQPPKFLTLVRF